MRRRAFGALAGVAAAWPWATSGQQATLPIVGFLSSRAQRESAPFVDSFRRGLAEQGYVEGRDLAIDYRFAEGNYDQLEVSARALSARPLSAIAAFGQPAALAAKLATRTIPVVFVGSGAVRNGLVASFNRPGGNLTGVDLQSSELAAKRLELLGAMAPAARTIALLVNPDNPESDVHLQTVRSAAARMGRQLIVVQAKDRRDLDATYAGLARGEARALIVQNDPFFDSQRIDMIAWAARSRVPSIYHIRDFPLAGGLMSYGASLVDSYRLAGDYVGRVLKGAHPRDLPVLQPTRLELVINLATARTLGLYVPALLLAQAEEIIE